MSLTRRVTLPVRETSSSCPSKASYYSESWVDTPVTHTPPAAPPPAKDRVGGTGPCKPRHQFPRALALLRRERVSVTSSAAQKRALRADGDTHLISRFGVLAETCEQGGGGAGGVPEGAGGVLSVGSGEVRTQEGPAEHHPGWADTPPLRSLYTRSLHAAKSCDTNFCVPGPWRAPFSCSQSGPGSR